MTTDQALRWTAGALLALLAWQGREILTRLDTLERNQTKILMHLGIPPVGRDTLDFGVKNRDFATLETIKEIKPPLDTPETLDNFPLTGRWYCRTMP